MKPIGKLDTSHAMYPLRRPKKLSKYEQQATERALHETSIIETGGIVPDPNGSQAQREAWMRERQSRIGAEREKLRLPHPPKKIQQRWIDEGEK